MTARRGTAKWFRMELHSLLGRYYGLNDQIHIQQNAIKRHESMLKQKIFSALRKKDENVLKKRLAFYQRQVDSLKRKQSALVNHYRKLLVFAGLKIPEYSVRSFEPRIAFQDVASRRMLDESEKIIQLFNEPPYQVFVNRVLTDFQKMTRKKMTAGSC